jgi:hypothetical protein
MPDKLTEELIRNARSAEKTYRLFDGGGMYLEVSTKGSRYWRLKYRIDGKEKRISLGIYPSVSLELARERRDHARLLVAQGTDPSSQRRQEKQSASEAALLEAAELQAAANGSRLKVAVYPEGMIEIWKGRQALRLSTEEAATINNLLTSFLHGGFGHGE